MDVKPLQAAAAEKLQLYAATRKNAAHRPAMAFDETVRRFDADGHLRVTRCVLSAAGVSPYHGAEIPDYQHFGLDPQRVYAIYRPASELAKAAKSFDGKPILASHCPIHASQHPRAMTIGAVGHAFFKDDALVADLTIWDGEAISEITSGAQRSVSAGYRYRVTAEDGCVNGQSYHLRMTDIQFNHLALVERPRVPQAVIGDEALSVSKKKRQVLLKLLGKSAPLEREAAPQSDEEDDDLKSETASFVPQAPDVQNRSADEEAQPSSDLPQRLYDALQNHELDAASSIEEIIRWFALNSSGERGVGAEENASMRAAVLAERSLNRRAERARQAVRPLVGEVCGLDDADEIYRYALKQLDVPADDVDASALPALVTMAGRASGLFPSTIGRGVAPVAQESPLSRADFGLQGYASDDLDVGSILYGIPVPKKL